MTNLENVLKNIRRKTRVFLFLDKSGSMESISKFAVDSINEQFKEFIKNSEEQDIYLTYVQFDSTIETIYFNRLVDQNLNLLDYDQYTPSGGTALNDAIGQTIQKMKELDDFASEDIAYLVIAITDGMDNASNQYKQKDIAELIKSLEETSRWTFTYMGANVDVKKIAKDYNLSTSNVMSYNASKVGLDRGTTQLRNSQDSYFSSRLLGATQTRSFYDESVDKNVLLPQEYLSKLPPISLENDPAEKAKEAYIKNTLAKKSSKKA